MKLLRFYKSVPAIRGGNMHTENANLRPRRITFITTDNRDQTYRHVFSKTERLSEPQILSLATINIRGMAKLAELLPSCQDLREIKFHYHLCKNTFEPMNDVSKLNYFWHKPKRAHHSQHFQLSQTRVILTYITNTYLIGVLIFMALTFFRSLIANKGYAFKTSMVGLVIAALWPVALPVKVHTFKKQLAFASYHLKSKQLCFAKCAEQAQTVKTKNGLTFPLWAFKTTHLE